MSRSIVPISTRDVLLRRHRSVVISFLALILIENNFKLLYIHILYVDLVLTVFFNNYKSNVNLDAAI